jgi:hypothetical protein
VCGKPVSYLIELLVVYSSTLLPVTATARDVLHKFWKVVTDYHGAPLRVAFTRPTHPTAYYADSAVDWKALGHMSNWAVVDVANPTNLVNFQFKDDGMQLLANYARATLVAIAR